MSKKTFVIFILLINLFSFFAMAPQADAAFGISPPYVKSKQALFPGSHYEQTVTLLRSAQDDDLQARIVVEAPEIADWITIREGELFDLPKGKTQVPMLVMVDVPEKAEIGDYKGYINIQIVPKGAAGGGVAIALGARVDIDLSVTNETFLDFLVRKIDILDLEEFKAPWRWQPFKWLFYRVKVVMNIENTGNTPIAPSKVELDVYDITEKNRLETLIDTRLKKIAAFTTGEVVADFSTNLPAGQYWGNIKVYKENEIVHKNKIIFTISKPGAMENPPKLSKWAYALAGAFILLFLVIILILIKIRIWRHLSRLLMIILWPVFYIWRKLRQLSSFLNRKFWQWMHEKSKQYQKIDRVKNNKTQNDNEENEE